ncbi:UrcA family protein [Wenzhouxiangella sp. AB-CW3]|uniref:UrcA family protein n=1 Tax=Wenzhouxiangella sp. AB-CW3 TaxID=2771012 RepID=UPI00168A5D06|nr:UrcA family protein [Wenzhouxiangella sp. AB-CW3]QOC23434.1 UrcA family protein [Wenzhouxiangella sp. AB-CW3]
MTRFILLTGTIMSMILMSLLASDQSSLIESAHADEEASVDRITVFAPRITRERSRRGSMAHVEKMERTAVVDFSDLDLSRTADLFELEDRIHEAASTICEELAESYPQGQPATPVCIRRAVDDAMADARLLARSPQ